MLRSERRRRQREKLADAIAEVAGGLKMMSFCRQCGHAFDEHNSLDGKWFTCRGLNARCTCAQFIHGYTRRVE